MGAVFGGIGCARTGAAWYGWSALTAGQSPNLRANYEIVTRWGLDIVRFRLDKQGGNVAAQLLDVSELH
ncbi:hypothetical protein D3C84_1179630 [compost metagenome]